MYFFRNDYSEGAHPAIFDALAATNRESTVGYGRDPYCAEAIEAVRRRFACPEADVHFMLGGTITNLTLIAAGGVNPGNAGAYAACGVDGLATTAPFAAKPLDMSVRMRAC